MRSMVIWCTAVMLLISASSVMARDKGHVDTAAKISSAKTAADHQALAAHYEKQAAQARAQAERHDKMGASYTGADREKLHLEDHCKAVANSYREAAKELDALAAGERELARGSK